MLFYNIYLRSISFVVDPIAQNNKPRCIRVRTTTGGSTLICDQRQSSLMFDKRLQQFNARRFNPRPGPWYESDLHCYLPSIFHDDDDREPEITACRYVIIMCRHIITHFIFFLIIIVILSFSTTRSIAYIIILVYIRIETANRRRAMT